MGTETAKNVNSLCFIGDTIFALAIEQLNTYPQNALKVSKNHVLCLTALIELAAKEIESPQIGDTTQKIQVNKVLNKLEQISDELLEIQQEAIKIGGSAAENVECLCLIGTAIAQNTSVKLQKYPESQHSQALVKIALPYLQNIIELTLIEDKSLSPTYELKHRIIQFYERAQILLHQAFRTGDAFAAHIMEVLRTALANVRDRPQPNLVQSEHSLAHSYFL
jgi:hypothetical protein